jgi:hypothetical protein
MPKMSYIKIEKGISSARLSSYRNLNQTRAYTLKKYGENIQLCEALYPLMQQLEIVLRNQFELVLVKKYGQDWFRDSKLLYLLDRHERGEVFKAVEKLASAKKSIHSGSVVAELMFGFWTSLFSKTYEAEFWRPYNTVLFPATTPNNRNVQMIRDELTKIRQLRNRIAHHEPINKKPSELWNRYETIVKLLEWMNPDIMQWLRSSRCDRFTSVFNKIYTPKVKKVKI